MEILYYFAGVITLLFVYFLTMFVIAQKIKNNSIVDIGWGFGFVLIAIYSLIFYSLLSIRWGLRCL